MTNFIGRSLGRYHILEKLGEGGMATVYKAYDTRLERDVAVKVIRVEQFAPAVLERILKRFEREAKSLARLTHPNIVHVNDYGDQDGIPYLVMDYLPGGTLKQRLGQPMPWQEAVRILLPIAQALDYAHEQKIIHRDIKPSNILLTKKGQPMLSDFGIAKILDLDDGQSLSTPGVGIGTPEYMSPEQGMGKPVGPGTDIYSLGIVLYELLTRRKPFTANTPMAVVVKHLNDPLPRPRQYVPNLPEEVEKILLKALAKKPEDRYTDMAAFVVALENLTSRPISQPDAPRPRVGDSMAANDQVATRDEIDPAPAKRIAISTSQRNPPNVLQDKKRAWWPWAAGAGGLVAACIAIAVLVVPGLLKMGQMGQGPLAALATATLIPTRTMTPSNTLIPTASPTQTSIPEELPGLAGKWQDPETTATFVIAWQNLQYVVVSVTWKGKSYSITSQSWTGSSLTWSYYNTDLSLTVTYTTTSLSGDSLDVNWSYNNGSSGTETLDRPGLFYNNSSAGISLTYPVNWQYSETGDASSGYTIIFASSADILNIYPDIPQTGAELILYTNYLKTSDVSFTVNASSMVDVLDFITNSADTKFSQGQNLHTFTLGGYPAASGVYTKTNDTGRPSTVYLITILRNDKIMLFLGVCPQNEWAQYQPVFDSIMNSVSIVTP